MEEKTLISIIVPIYNIKEEYLSKCIESLINQSLKNIEILLVDDKSTNNSLDICEKYAKMDKRIKVLEKKHEGVSATRNLGLKNAKSPYIMFVDGDDWIDNKCCEEAYKQAQEGFDIVSWSYFKEYESGKREKIEIFKQDRISKDDSNEFDYYDMRILGSTCMKLYSKHVIGEERFNEKLINGEDVEFNFRIFKKINSIKFINKNYYNYVIRKDSTVRKYNSSMVENYNITFDAMEKEVDYNDEKRSNGFFSFVAISFLMILLNFIFSKQNAMSYKEKVKLAKNISNTDTYKKMLRNINKLNIPITRKLPIIFAKYHLYFLLYLILKLKERLSK